VKATDPSRLSINAATLSWERHLRTTLEALDRANIRAISPWRNQIQSCGVTEAANMLADYGMTVTGLCRAGFFTARDNGPPTSAINEVLRAIDEAAAIRATCLVIVVGGLPRGSKDLAGAHRQVAEGLAAVLPHARACGVPLAIEPLHPMLAADRGCVNSLAHANDLCDHLGAGVGIAVDVYHVWWDRTLEREIHRAGRDRLLAFHICDWLVPTCDLVLDRGMMGDGVVDLPRIREWLEAAGYDGYHEVEIFSANNWWKREPDDVLRICRERHRTVC
jgi:sugar phosphate isomerase/epimerase